MHGLRGNITPNKKLLGFPYFMIWDMLKSQICCVIHQRKCPHPDLCAYWYKLEWERQSTGREQNLREKLVGCTERCWGCRQDSKITACPQWKSCWLRKVTNSWAKSNSKFSFKRARGWFGSYQLVLLQYLDEPWSTTSQTPFPDTWETRK